MPPLYSPSTGTACIGSLSSVGGYRTILIGAKLGEALAIRGLRRATPGSWQTPLVSRAKRGVASVLVAVALLAIVGLMKQRRFEARCLGRNWPGAMVRAPGGPVHVWCEGTGYPVVLFEASGLGSSMQYRHVLPAVARRTTACAWDRQGMGLSPPTPGAASAPD